MTNRIDTRLKAARDARRFALAPFVTIGFPSVDTSIDIANAVRDVGADMLELGVPFSDPLAEGPTIQKTSFHALQQGVNYKICLDAVRKVRKHNRDAALVLMGYYNPLLSYGLEKAVRDAASAGADGFIVPDLPTAEAGPFQKICDAHRMYLIPLLALTSTDERIEHACKSAENPSVKAVRLAAASARFSGDRAARPVAPRVLSRASSRPSLRARRHGR